MEETTPQPEETPAPIVMRWVGPGWYPNCPARDLTQADVDDLLLNHPQDWADALSLGIYSEVA